MVKKFVPPVDIDPVVQKINEQFEENNTFERNLVSNPFALKVYGNIDHEALSTRQKLVPIPAEITNFINEHVTGKGKNTAALVHMMLLGKREIEKALLKGDYEIKQ